MATTKKINTIRKAQNTEAITLSANVWSSGTRAANALNSAKDDALALLSSKQFPLKDKEQIAKDLHNFFVNTLDNKVLAKIPSKEQKDGSVIYAFRSAPATKVMWQWQTVVSKAVESGATYKDIFEMKENKIKSGDFKFPTRKQIYDLCSTQTTELEKFQALMESASKVAKKIKAKADIRKAESLCSEVLNALNKS